MLSFCQFILLANKSRFSGAIPWIGSFKAAKKSPA
jgi:hypothetical protein